MSIKELTKRYILFIISLFFSGVGVGFCKHGDIGISPISSVSNVLAMKYTFMSFGMWQFTWNMILLAAQIVILRKAFQKIQLLQIPLSLAFGIFCDLGVVIATHTITIGSYPTKITSLVIGVVVMSFGIALSVIANVVLNSGEAVVKALAEKSGMIFGYMKIIFDVSCVAFSVVASFVFFGKLLGVREGTLICALTTGLLVKFFTKHLTSGVEKVLRA